MFLKNIWIHYSLLLINCVCALNEINQTSSTVNRNVPLIISDKSFTTKITSIPLTLNASSTASLATTARNFLIKDVKIPAVNLLQNTVQKVPLRRNASENSAISFMQQQQTPSSSVFANYNNQQNVLQLVRNIDTRLRNIRNVEMRVTTIQEIFDAMHFSSSSMNSKNNSDWLPNKSLSALLYQDLQIFCKRLENKLQKAAHIVLELRDFFRTNITKLQFMQNSDYSEDEELGVNSQNDQKNFIKLQLNTYIQPFYANIEKNYNKQQIQILNYIKTETQNNKPAENQQQQDEELSSPSLQANSYISDKMENLKNRLSKADDFSKSNINFRNAPNNSKLKYIGNNFKHIYFLSRSDDASDLHDHFYYDMNFRHLYVSAIAQKFVLLLIDVGSAMNAELLELTKNFVFNVLQLLSDTDLITVVTVSDEARSMLLDTYMKDATNGMYYTTRDCKFEILNYINNLSGAKVMTNHSLGFEYAFQMIEMLQNASLLTKDNPIAFVYLTRGLLTNLTDAMHVQKVIASEQRKLFAPIIINTCAVVMDEKRMMYEKQFLADIALQNYTKKYIKQSSNGQFENENINLVGKFFVLTKTQPNTIVRASTAIFTHFFEELYLSQSLKVHTPVFDANTKEAIVSVTHTAGSLGVVGVNLYLADLIEDVVNYRQQIRNINKNDDTYAFLIDRNGITLAHPAFPRLITQNQTPFPVDIGYLENSTDFAHIRKRMLQDTSDNATTTVYLTYNKKTELMQRTYQWQTVLAFYVICLVSTTKMPNQPTKSNTTAYENLMKSTNLQMETSMPILHRYRSINKDTIATYQTSDYEYTSVIDLLYHRLDLIPSPNSKVCRYFRQMATLDAATLFLSAAAFESPFTFLHNNRLNSRNTQIRIVESIMAYLKDTTGLIANPGLRPQIRQEVNALYSAMQHLKKRHQDARGTLKNYIIRRYIATVNGVLEVYPGCLLSNIYDATRRPWFRKAMHHPGKIITTEPYLDAAGAGHIITIAHTIFEGKANALHSPERDQPVAIVALDLPYAYYYKLILETSPLCQSDNIKCLLFENEGYLIAHPSMLEISSAIKNQRRPHEHLTHKESFLANDILNHKSLVRKLACSNFQNRTIQRYYAFNVSLVDILTNVVHGERTKYSISLVRGSNIFAAVLNSTCDGGAFCPCSTIDRICLNCNRMDQTDCECPCECPMDSDAFNEIDDEFNAFVSNYTQQYAYCEPPSENFISLPQPNDYNLLQSCVNINCDIYGTQNDCLAVMGCEWCQQDLDGNSFSAAFCTTQAACFNGVLSSLTPYGDLDEIDIITAHSYNPGQKVNSYSAFGPVGGAIIVLVFVIGFAIYCYRHNLDTSSQDQFYIDSMQEENYGLPLSRFNFDDCQAHDEPPGSAYDHTAAQRNLMNPADISPYHVSTGSSYRRPPNGESDHGYSTMTPHEDSSDHQCFTLAEPLLLNDKRNSKSDTLSISTSISSPTNRNQQQQHHHNQYPNQTTTRNSTKDARYNLTSPKKFHTTQTTALASPKPTRVYEQTVLPLSDEYDKNKTVTPHYILAPVTVHRHMETSES